MANSRKKKSSRIGPKKTNKHFHPLDSLTPVDQRKPAIQETNSNIKHPNVPIGRRSTDRVDFVLYDCWLSLSEREQDVTYLTCQGHKDQQIAFKMGVSRRTVRSYLENVYHKVGVRSKVDLRLEFVNFDFEQHYL